MLPESIHKMSFSINLHSEIWTVCSLIWAPEIVGSKPQSALMWILLHSSTLDERIWWQWSCESCLLTCVESESYTTWPRLNSVCTEFILNMTSWLFLFKAFFRCRSCFFSGLTHWLSGVAFYRVHQKMDSGFFVLDKTKDLLTAARLTKHAVQSSKTAIAWID